MQSNEYKWRLKFVFFLEVKFRMRLIHIMRQIFLFHSFLFHKVYLKPKIVSKFHFHYFSIFFATSIALRSSQDINQSLLHFIQSKMIDFSHSVSFSFSFSLFCFVMYYFEVKHIIGCLYYIRTHNMLFRETCM